VYLKYLTFPEMKKPILYLYLAFILSSCQTTQYASPDLFNGKEIIISEGGGFSGQTTQHVILENGQVFVRTTYPASLNELTRLKKKIVEEIFNRIEMLNVEQVSFLHPGNMTYSLSLKTGQEIHDIKWGDPGFPVSPQILECYQFIHDQINSNNKP
jgi:hypothetical protein